MSVWQRVVRHGELGWQIGTTGVDSTIFVSDATPLGQVISPDLNRRFALAQVTGEES